MADLDLKCFESSFCDWVNENCPDAMRSHMPMNETVWGGRQETFIAPDSKLWFERFVETGLAAASWPQEYGGAGLTPSHEKIIKRVLSQQGARQPLMSLGIPMMGPTIMEYGSEAQKLQFLPDIARGRVRWCQGYSEPGAGSDLASLKTKAERQGDHYIVTGQKVWTSHADKSDYLFCLVRTDFTASKHNGISVLLIDMDWPGVSTQPIELLSGSSHFCEVFLDEVRVPVSHLLGEENKGWSIAKRMLQHERSMMGEMGAGASASLDLPALAKTRFGEIDGRLAEPVYRDQIAQVMMERAAVDLTTARIAQEFKTGQLSAAPTMLKYAMSEAEIRKFEVLLEIEGDTALHWLAADAEHRSGRDWAFSKIQRIGGGTSEIQLNIIAKRVLGLPD